MSDYLKDGFIDEVVGCLGKEESGSGQANVIESIKVNGVDQSVDSNKSVDIPVPTKTSDLDNDSGYMTEDQVNSKVTEGVGVILEDVYELNSNLSDNEFDLKANTFVDSKIINSSGVEATAGGWKASDYVLISSTITKMIFTFESSGETASLAFYDENKNVLLAKPYDGNKIIKVTVPPKSKYFRYTVNITASTHSVKGYGITRVVKQQNESLDDYYIELDKLGVLVPFSIKSGESFTISTQDGSNFTPVKIGFYDENETEIDNWDLAGYGSNKRTITYNVATAYYVSIYGGSAQKCRIFKSNNDLSRQLSNTQYAVGNIKNDLGVKSGDIIYTSCEVENSSFCWCKKSGHIVQCSLYLKNINATTNWQVILTLPFRPCSPFYIYDKKNDAEWQIGTNGVLTRFDLSTNLRMLVSFTYITND